MGGNRQDIIDNVEKTKQYEVVLSEDAVQDIKKIKRYIIKNFKYREYADNFSKKIKSAIKNMEYFTKGYSKTGYIIDGLEVYYKPFDTYLIFFVIEGKSIIVVRVLKDRMYWQHVINQIKNIHR